MNSMDIWNALGQLDDELVSAAACKRKEEYGMSVKKENTGRYARRLGLIAAIVAVFAAMSITAYATNLFGIKSRIMDTKPQTGFEDFSWVSVAGGMDSAEYKAAEEWESFHADYLNQNKVDSASLKTGYATAGDAQRAAAYYYYGGYDVTLIQTVQEIAAKYGLKLHTEFTQSPDVQTLLDAGAGNIFPEGEMFSGYFYEDGSYKMEMACGGGVLVAVTRSVKGTLPPYGLSVRDLDSYAEEEYVASSGVTVQLMFSETHRRGIAMYETGDSVFCLNMNYFAQPEPTPGTEPISMNTLKDIVDSFDLTKLDG